jgi:hypothetical protein
VIINCGRNSKAGYDNIGIAIDYNNSITNNYFYNNCVFNGDENSPVVFLRGYFLTIAQFNNQSDTIDVASDNIQIDPLLETPDSLYYYLTGSSPCIDAGMDVGLHFDFYGNPIYFGNAPDIGIHEYSNSIGIFSEKSTAADNFILEQNYPNPFNPATTINYQLPQSGLVQLNVYNLIGQEVATLVNEVKFKGKYSVTFNAENLPSGVYIYSLHLKDFVQNQKMTLVK